MDWSDLPKHFVEGMIEGRRDEEEDISSYWLNLGKENMLKLERGSARWHSIEDSLSKGLRTCHKAYCSLMLMTPQRSYTTVGVGAADKHQVAMVSAYPSWPNRVFTKTNQKFRFQIILGNKLGFEAGTFIAIVKFMNCISV